jgi:hypothetical protein
MEEIIDMALLLMQFYYGMDTDLYQESINGQVTRWFDLEGNEIELPDNEGRGVSYGLKDISPPIPSWYVDPTAQ